tara:strand:- start:28 stop:231 length:204 start_codon:yes stop_codon:yes gene_type:complete
MLILLSLLLIFQTTPAYAYLDPGIGSLLIQGLIAAIAAVTTYCSIYWKKIKDFFSNKKKQDEKKEKE